MNTTNILKLAACFAWAGVAVSSAAPASARCATYQSGTYANCSPTYFTGSGVYCWNGEPWIYRQIIKFSSTACSTGGCSSESGDVHTDVRYSTGRKPASVYGGCGNNTMTVYNLGSCAC
jgi:hypothetical protein